MTKNELAREVAVADRLHLSTVLRATDGIIRVIGEAIAKGDTNIFIRGLGTFKVVVREAKVGRDFKTGENITIPAKKIIKFTPAKELIAQLPNE